MSQQFFAFGVQYFSDQASNKHGLLLLKLLHNSDVEFLFFFNIPLLSVLHITECFMYLFIRW